MQKNAPVKFEKDNRFIRFRVFTIIISIFLLTFVANKIFKQVFDCYLSFNALVVLNSIISSFLFLFPANEVQLESNHFVFKNIYGITLKKIEKKDVRSIKVVYFEVPSKAILLFFMMGKKYDKMTQVKFILEDSKKYTINGAILSDKGLKKLRKK